MERSEMTVALPRGVSKKMGALKMAWPWKVLETKTKKSTVTQTNEQNDGALKIASRRWLQSGRRHWRTSRWPRATKEAV